jgi:copper resistance protein B
MGAGWLLAIAAGVAGAAQPPGQPPSDAPPVTTQPEQSMTHDMGDMDMSGMQGGRAPPDARDPDYSEGQTMSMLPGMSESMDDAARFGKVLIDQLEYVHASDANGAAIDAQAYYGGDSNKLWFKVDGERTSGRLRDTRIEVLGDHATSAFWDAQMGVRRDFGGGPGRTWAAIGIQGLAPYWIDIEATAYVGQSGRTAMRVEGEYDIMLTQRLIFTPDLELNAYGKTDAARHIGSGLSNVELGLRLRYEISRKFAPYVGIDWNRRFGKTADLMREAGEPASERQVVAGVRIWF